MKRSRERVCARVAAHLQAELDEHGLTAGEGYSVAVVFDATGKRVGVDVLRHGRAIAHMDRPAHDVVHNASGWCRAHHAAFAQLIATCQASRP